MRTQVGLVPIRQKSLLLQRPISVRPVYTQARTSNKTTTIIDNIYIYIYISKTQHNTKQQSNNMSVIKAKLLAPDFYNYDGLPTLSISISLSHYISLYIYMYIHIYTYIYTYIYIYTCYIYIYICICMCTCICMYIYIYIHIYVCIYIYMYMLCCMYIYIYIYIYMLHI